VRVRMASFPPKRIGSGEGKSSGDLRTNSFIIGTTALPEVIEA